MPSLPAITSPPSPPPCLLQLCEVLVFLGKAEVVIASSDGFEHLAAQNVVAFILGEIEFYDGVSKWSPDDVDCEKLTVEASMRAG